MMAKSIRVSVIFTLLLLMLTSIVASAQNNKGKDFWVAEMPNNTTINSPFVIYVANSSGVDAHVTISQPGTGGGTFTVVQTGTIASGSLAPFSFASANPTITRGLPVGSSVMPASTSKYTLNVYHIESDVNIVVYAFTPLVNVQTNDAELLLPTNALGKKYYLGSYVHSNIAATLSSQFGVVATGSGTTFIRTLDRTGAVMDTVTLNQGEYFQRMNGNLVANDVTGWYVESSQPVAVFTGNQITAVGTVVQASDHLVEQALPVETLSKTLIGAPTNARPVNCTTCAPDVFRYVATVDGTTINTSVAFSAVKNNTGSAMSIGPSTAISLNKGEFIEISTATPHIVTASNPIYGYQYLVSQNQVGNSSVRIGDPSLLTLPVVDQFQYDYQFLIPSTFAYNYIDVIAPSGTNFIIDGNAVANVNWRSAGSVGNKTYQVAVVPVTFGSHKIVADQKFGLTVEGFDVFASYAYLGGSGLEPINAGCITGGPYQKFECLNRSTSIQLKGTATCESGSPRIKWTSPDGVVFSDATIADPIATVPGFGTYSITMTVSCGSGGTANSVSCTSEIIVREPLQGCANVPISLTPPPDVVVPTDAGQNYATNVSIGTATYVATEPATLTNTGITQYPVGTTSVTWTVTDVYGRTASGTQKVTVVPPPSIAPPPAILVATDNGQTYATVTDLYSTNYWNYDQSSGTFWVYNNQTTPIALNVPAGNQFPSNNVDRSTTTTVTWTTGRDQWGRSASGTQDITVVPPPTIQPPADIVVPAAPGQTSVSISNLGTATYWVYNNFSSPANDGSGSYPLGTTVVTWTVKDQFGRTATGTQKITVAPPPTIAPPAAILVPTDAGQNYATVSSLHDASYWQYDETSGTYWVYGNTSTPTVSGVPAGNQFPSASVNSATTTTVTWTTGADQWNRSASGTQTVTVVPPPTIVAPADFTIVIPSGTSANISDLGTSTYWVYENYSTPTNDGTGTYPVGSTTVTWKIRDQFGRIATATQVVKVVLAPPPSIVPPAAILVPTDPGQNFATVSSLHDAAYWQYDQASGTYFVYNNTATPTVTGVPVGNQYPSNNVNSATTTTVTWTTGADQWGRSANGTQDITVVPPPTIVAPADITVVIPSGTSSTIGNLGAASYWVYNNFSTPSNDGIGNYPVGTTTVTWTIKDQFGRKATATQLVKVVLAPPPSIVPPAAILVPTDPGQNFATVSSLHDASYWQYDQASGTYFVYNNTATPTVTGVPVGNQFPSASVNSATTTTVTWTTGADQWGRSASGTQDITVVPPPTIVAPADITVVIPSGTSSTIGNLGAASYWVYNNFSTPSNDGIGNYPVGTTTVTWTIKDQFGRKATATQLVKVVLAPPPSIVPPAAILVPTDAGKNYATVNNLYNAGYWQYAQNGGTYFVYNNTAIPTASGVPAGNQFPSASVNSATTTTVTWTTGKDQWNRSASGTQTVTVVPPPTIVAPADITVVIPSGTSTTVSNLGTSTYWVYNNYSTPTNDGSGSYAVGSTTVTWTIKDQFGRKATATQLVKVVLAPPPSIVPPAAILVPTDAGKNYATVSNLYNAGYWQYAQNGGTYFVYNNTAIPTASGVPAGNQFPSASVNSATTTTVTWTTGTDAWGRSASGQQKVTVVPPPTIVAPPAITVTIPYGSTSATISSLGSATYWVYNNFSTPTNNGTATYPVGTTTVTWTIKDQFGRTATGTQLITVNVEQPVVGTQGCTPGFWKNWPQAWGCGYTSTTKFFSVFAGVTNYRKVSTTLTLMEAVDLNGGSYNALIRHAGAAILDACHPKVAYPYTQAQIKSAVVAMFNSGVAVLGGKTYTDVDALKNELERCNQLGCPLGMTNYSPLVRGSVQVKEEVLTAKVYPNPSASLFTLQVKSSDENAPINIRIIDAFGRTVEVMSNIGTARTVIFGEKYASGAYYAEILQGEQKRVLPLMKTK